MIFFLLRMGTAVDTPVVPAVDPHVSCGPDKRVVERDYDEGEFQQYLEASAKFVRMQTRTEPPKVEKPEKVVEKAIQKAIEAAKVEPDQREEVLAQLKQRQKQLRAIVLLMAIA